MADFDDLWVSAGGFGRYQVLFFMWYIISCFVTGGNNLFMVFGMIAPKFIGNCSGDLNITADPNCSMVNPQFYSLAMEWQLYGPYEYIVAAIASTQMFGIFFGPTFAGQISDRFGRKRTMLIYLTGLTVCRLSTYFMTSWKLYTVTVFFIGFFLGGFMNVKCVLFMESVRARWRFTMFVGSMGYVWLGFCAHFAGNWRLLTVVISAPAVILFLLSFFIHESPKWLQERSRIPEARAIMIKIARFNGANVPSLAQQLDELMPLDELVTNEKTGVIVENHSKSLLTYWHLFHNSKFSKYTLIMALVSISAGLLYYGLMFNLGRLVGETAINLILVNLMRLVTLPVVTYLDMRHAWFTRKRLYLFAFILLTILMSTVIILYLVPINDGVRGTLLNVVSFLAIVGTGFMWMVIDLYLTELYPSVIRTMGFGLNSSVTRVGTMVSPQVILLHALFKPAPFIVFLTVFVLAFICSYPFLPETKGRPLPELEDHVFEMKFMDVINVHRENIKKYFKL